jgi:glycine/sarcosine N-methyltransferase
MTDAGGVEAFYDRLAEHYHLIFGDWRAGGRWQAEVLLPVLEAAAGGSVRTLLDPTCGIGTQAIPFAELGIAVRGTDLSRRALERARAEAAAAGVAVVFAMGDVRELAERGMPAFDAVVSLDNSLAHLLDDGDLERAMTAMVACARPGGAVVVSVRDYDAQAGPEPPRVFGQPPERHAVVALWQWQEGGVVYRLDHLLLEEAGGWSVLSSGSVLFRAYQRADLEAAFTAAGLRDVRWLTPDESGYYQPLVVGTRP